MIVIEGIVARTVRAREEPERGKGEFTAILLLSPWRQVGAPWTRDPVEIHIPADVDLADAWMRAIEPGHTVRAHCTALDPATAGKPPIAHGQDLDLEVILT